MNFSRPCGVTVGQPGQVQSVLETPSHPSFLLSTFINTPDVFDHLHNLGSASY